ncbi:MAG: TonB-dependent receptor, partial [Thermodesulfobacteriota bacterium]|nr:TonB-dependent receptor [Thermodesulfobacteriota bacterium]
HVETTIIGGKTENEQSTDLATFTYGFDIYYRNWDGYQINNDTGVVTKPDFFPDADALNLGLYLKAEKNSDKWYVSCGIRGDYFETEANDLVNGKLRYSQILTDTDKDRDAFASGYLLAKYYISEQSNFFGGVGHSIRTPTLVERYLQAGTGFYGNPDLKATKNTELDFGFETNVDRVNFKIKGFYSWLKDYIYQQAPPKTWTNIDAHIYGADVTALVGIGYDLSIEAAAAYQRGRKDSQPLNNKDENLAQIPPLKTKLALHYDNSKVFGILELIHSRCTDDVDIDAGEQELKGWDVVNARAGYQYKDLTFNVGVNNIFDRKYAVANSYEWDVVSGAGASPKIVNEPGRFFYGSISCLF